MKSQGQSFAFLVILLFLLPGCLGQSSSTNDSEDDEEMQMVCSGSPMLCDRSYDNVTFPETHNSFATHEDGILYPASNHQTGLAAQWGAGMRAFMVDAHYSVTTSDPTVNDIRFCHGDPDRGISPCVYGEVVAVQWLEELRLNMDQAQHDVVTLLIESYVPADHIQYILEQVGLWDRLYVHELGQPWPTLRTMIADETTLVVFWESVGDPTHPWLHDFLVHGWTTDFSEDNPEDMNCDVYRGDGDQSLFHMNNWLRNPTGTSDPTRAGEVNNVQFLVGRGVECWQQHGKRPTFLAVDWWEEGDVVEASRILNEYNDWSEHE